MRSIYARAAFAAAFVTVTHRGYTFTPTANTDRWLLLRNRGQWSWQ
jgi:hypothetical protein